MSISLEEPRLSAFLEHQLVGAARAYVVDSTGKEIVTAGDRAGSSLPGIDLTAALKGPIETQGRLVAASPIAGTRWTYVLDAPVSAVLAPTSSSAGGEWGLLAGLATSSLAGLVVATRATASRSQARRETAEVDRRFRLTVENAPVGMTMVGLDHRFIEPNARLCRMLGYDNDELESMTFTQVTHPDDREARLGLVEQLLGGGLDAYKLEKRYLRRDGMTLWAD